MKTPQAMRVLVLAAGIAGWSLSLLFAQPPAAPPAAPPTIGPQAITAPPQAVGDRNWVGESGLVVVLFGAALYAVCKSSRRV